MEAAEAQAATHVPEVAPLDMHRTVSTGLSPRSQPASSSVSTALPGTADAEAAPKQQLPSPVRASNARQVTTNALNALAGPVQVEHATANCNAANSSTANKCASAQFPCSDSKQQQAGNNKASSPTKQQADVLAGQAAAGNDNSGSSQQDQQQQPPVDRQTKAHKRPSADTQLTAQQQNSSSTEEDDDDLADMQTVKRRRPAPASAVDDAPLAATIAADQQQQMRRQTQPAAHSHIRRHHAVDDDEADGGNDADDERAEELTVNVPDSTVAATAGSPEKQQKQRQHAAKGHQSQQHHKRSKGQPKQLLSFTEEEDVEGSPASAAAEFNAGGSSSNAAPGKQQKSKHSQLGGLARATASRFAQELKQAAAAARMVFKPSSNAGSSPPAGAAAAAAGNGAAAAGGAVLVDEDVDPRVAASGAAATAALSQIHFGFAVARGHRPYMEDRHTIITALNPAAASTAAAALEAAAGGSSNEDAAAAANGNVRDHQHAAAAHHDGVGRSYAAIFDGHNGAGAAETAARKLHLLLASHPALRLYRGETGPPAVVKQEEQAVGQALKSAFRQIDDLVLGVARREGTRDGATALVLLRLGHALYSAHAGDSRAVLCRDATAYRLTEDHKPHLPHERSRIEEAGGRVDFQRCWRVVVEPRDGRPGSGLAVSRSLGDLDFKEPYRFVECEPDVTRLVMQPHRDSFIILGSDGLWDVLSDTDAVIVAARALKQFAASHHNPAAVVGIAPGAVGARQRLQHNSNPHAHAAAAAGFATADLPDNMVYSDAAATAAAEALLAESMRRGTMDNVTVIVMLLQWS